MSLYLVQQLVRYRRIWPVSWNDLQNSKCIRDVICKTLIVYVTWSSELQMYTWH